MRFVIHTETGPHGPTSEVWHWRLVAGDGRLMATSVQGYDRRGDCLDAIALVRTTAASAVIYDDAGRVVMR